jgi:hypothetical protein
MISLAPKFRPLSIVRRVCAFQIRRHYREKSLINQGNTIAKKNEGKRMKDESAFARPFAYLKICPTSRTANKKGGGMNWN